MSLLQNQVVNLALMHGANAAIVNLKFVEVKLREGPHHVYHMRTKFIAKIGVAGEIQPLNPRLVKYNFNQLNPIFIRQLRVA